MAVPTGEVPDEPAHLSRADSVTHWAIAGFRHQGTNAQGGAEAEVAVRSDVNLAYVGFEFTPGIPLAEKHVTLERLSRLSRFGWQRRPLPVAVSNTGVYPPTFYIPAALGLRAARGAGLNPFPAILVARLCNALVYVGLGCAAIGLARRGRLVLLCLLCLPMSLWLAASVNQDGLIIATAALSGALLTRHARTAWWAGAVLLGLAAMAKPYLAVLALVLPLVHPGRIGREALAGLLVASLPAALWNALMAAFVAVPFVRPPATEAGPLWAGPAGTTFLTTSPLDQLHILLASPARLVTLPIDSLSTNWDATWREFIGVLGNLDVMLPDALYALWVVVIILSVVSAVVSSPLQEPRTAARLVATNAATLASLILSLFVAFVLQYISWTRVGSALVEGVQGRYFIPITAVALPVAGFPHALQPWTAAISILVTATIVLAVLSSTLAIPLVVGFSYYVR
jgi:uncharacterized membrane protein